MKNLKYFLIFLLILIDYSLSINNNDNIIDVIINNCKISNEYNATELEDFKKHQEVIFNGCNDWISINSTKQLTDENRNNIRCLLVYESFITFCDKLTISQSKNHEILYGKAIKDNIDVVCEDLALLPQKSNWLRVRDIIKNEVSCRYLCTEFKEDKIVLNDKCERSFYYNNFKINDGVSANNSSIKTETTMKNDQDSNQNIAKNKDINETLIQKSKDETIQTISINDSKNLSAPIIITQGNKKIIAEATIGEVLKDHISQITNDKTDTSVKDSAQIIPIKPIETEGKQQEITNQNSVPNTSIPKQQTVKKTLNNIEEPQNNSDIDYNDQPPSGNTKNDLPNTGLANEQEYELEQDTYEKPDKLEQQPEQPKAQINNVNKEKDIPKRPKPLQFNEPYSYDADMDGNSYFFTYFSFICVAFVIGYVGYHNKQKILALLVEGRNERKSRGRRPNSANYHKLDSNLEEAISSSCSKNTSHIIY